MASTIAVQADSVTGPDDSRAESTESLPWELQQIIASGRRPELIRKGSSLSAAVFVAATMLLLWLSFTPVEFAPAAWIALVPLVLLIRLRHLPRGFYRHLWMLGFLWSLATLQWMRYGHPAMYGALAALAFYLALYFPVFVAISRRAVSAGIPVWVVVPVVWTALEFVRAYLLTGFSWYYLAHSQYRWQSLVQVADITGAYGVSFVVALANAVLAVQVPVGFLKRWGLDAAETQHGSYAVRRFLPAAVSLFTIIGCCVYGSIRFQNPASFGEGPTIALIQGNFTPEVKHDPDSWTRRYAIHDRLTRHCTELQPQFIVWPETMFPWPDRSVDDNMTDDQLMATLPAGLLQQSGFDRELVVETWRSMAVRHLLTDNSRMTGSALVMGIEAHVVGVNDLQAYNSAAFVRPDIGYVGRYDKIHRVIFGEYIPLKNLFPWLSNLTPFGPNYGIAAGTETKLFEYAGYQIAPLICFEDTVPHLVRTIAGQRTSEGHECDVLINLTNDAWFHGSSELDQHLITSTFRCIETRTPMVRAVNGGISAFIDGNGQVREPETMLRIDDDTAQYRPQLTEIQGMRDPETGRWRRQFSGLLYGQIPLDSRGSLYLKLGDWFAGGCLLLTLLSLFLRRRQLTKGLSENKFDND